MTDITLSSPPKSDCAYAYECLRSDILSGRIQPHERIIETAYAETLGISRTPVREALRLLERDGLVDFQPKRGATAREYLTQSEVEEVVRLRSQLQMSCVSETVENITHSELSAMAGCNAACAFAVDEKDSEGFFRYYDRFNHILLCASKMPFHIKLLEFLENYAPITFTVKREAGQAELQPQITSLDSWKLRRKALREHMAIWDALNRKDQKAYIEALSAHIDGCNARMKKNRQ